MGNRHAAWGRRAAARLAVCLLACCAVPVLAAGDAAAPQPMLPADAVQPLQPARLAGEGVYRWFGLRIYEARLWVGPQGYRDSAPAAAPFVLELRYARALQGSRIAEASAEQMEKTGAGSSVQRKAWLETMRSLFPDVREGDRIAGRYVPGAGASFYLNGVLLGGAQGGGPPPMLDAEFAQAFFGIWLSPRSTAPMLREALLRQAAAQP
jgi:hypothetical protein